MKQKSCEFNCYQLLTVVDLATDIILSGGMDYNIIIDCYRK